MNFKKKKTFSKSNFKNDLNGEKIAGQFLDLVFYDPVFQDYRRTENMYEQKKGVDIVAYTKSGRFMNIDEKVQLTQLGKPTPSFAFEVLSYNAKMDIVDGWLIKDNDTEYYLLGYFNKMNGNVRELEHMEQIKEFEFVLVSKQKIIDFLVSKGYDKDFLINESLKIKKIIDSGEKLPDEYEERETGFRKVLEYGINIFYTTYLAEKPLNVVIYRKHLDKLAQMIVRITTGKGGKVEVLKGGV